MQSIINYPSNKLIYEDPTTSNASGYAAGGSANLAVISDKSVDWLLAEL